MKYFIFNNKKVAYKNIIQKKKKGLKRNFERLFNNLQIDSNLKMSKHLKYIFSEVLKCNPLYIGK